MSGTIEIRAGQRDSFAGKAPASRQNLLNSVLPVLIAMGLASGVLFRGYDSVSGMAVSCIVNALLLILVTYVHKPTASGVAPMRLALILAVAGIIWAAVATMLVTETWPEMASPRLLSVLSGLAALLIGAILGRAMRWRAIQGLLDTMLLFYSVILVFGLLIRAVGTQGLFDYWSVERLGRFTGTVGNANVTAAIAGAFCVYALWRFVGLAMAMASQGRVRAWPLALAHIIAFTLMFGVAIVTASRFTTLLTVIGIVAVLIPERTLLRFPFRERGALAMGVLFLLLCLILLTMFTGLLAERVEWLGQGWADRMELWRHYFQIAMKQPLLGYGLGSFSNVNMHFLTDPRFAERAWAVNSAHNIVLQLLIVGGLPYLLLLGGAAGVILRQILVGMLDKWTGLSRTLATMTVLIFACALVDIPLDMPVTVSLALILGGLLWGHALNGLKAKVAAA